MLGAVEMGTQSVFVAMIEDELVVGFAQTPKFEKADSTVVAQAVAFVAAGRSPAFFRHAEFEGF